MSEDRCAPFEEDLSALIDGELDSEREAEVRAHAAGCAQCGSRLDALRGADEALRAIASEVPPVPERLAVQLRRRAGERVWHRRARRWALASGLLAAGVAALLAMPIPWPEEPARPPELPLALLETPPAPPPAPTGPRRGAPMGASAPEPALAAAPGDLSEEDLAIAAELSALGVLEEAPDLELIEQLEVVEALEFPDAEERRELRRRLSRPGELQPGDLARLERNLERWRALSPEERERMRRRWRRFQALPAAERKRLIEEHSRRSGDP